MPDLIKTGLIVGGGALGSALSGKSERDQINRNIRAGQNAITGVQERLPGQSQVLNNIISQGYSPYTQNASQDFQNYRQGVAGSGNLNYAPQGDFNYNLNQQAQQFLDPSMDFQIEEASKAVQASGANRGKLFSGATGKAISDRAQNIAETGYRDALQTAMADRGFQYGQFSDDINRDRDAIDFQANQQQRLIDNLGNVSNIGMEAMIGQAGNLSTIKSDEFQNLNQGDLQKAQLGMQRQGGNFFGDLISGGANAFSSIMGGGK